MEISFTATNHTSLVFVASRLAGGIGYSVRALQVFMKDSMLSMELTDELDVDEICVEVYECFVVVTGLEKSRCVFSSPLAIL